MKKLLYISFLTFYFSLFTFDVISQPSITWQWLYPGPYDLDDYGFGICASSDGNFFLAGGATGWSYYANYYVKKISPNGNVIWSKAIGGMTGLGIAYAVAPTPDGGCVATGSGGRFLKFDVNGDTTSNKVINDGNERRIFDIKRTTDNNYIACGRYNINNALIIKFNQSGDTLWQKTFLSPYIKQLYSIEEGIDGGYIAVGRNQNFFGDTIRLFIVKLADNGNVLWEKEYPNNDAISINKLNSNYIICGQREITKIDILGIRYESFEVDSLILSEKIKDMILLSSNRFVYTTVVVQDSVYARLILSDSSGNILHIKEIKFSQYIELNEIQVCPNSDMIFMGYALQNDTSYKSMVYAIRTDTTFNFPPINVIGILQIGNSVPQSFRLYQNYPNPFNPVTSIKYDIPRDNLVTIRIYDILGKEIFISSEFKKAGSYEVRFDGTNFASGMYFYSLEAGDFKDTKKMVLMK